MVSEVVSKEAEAMKRLVDVLNSFDGVGVLSRYEGQAEILRSTQKDTPLLAP